MSNAPTEPSIPLTLVIMAAGMGSRYGGLKQAEGVGPKGEWLLEYSLFDAARAGFTHAVIIIRPETEGVLAQRFKASTFHSLSITFAHQTLEDGLPKGFPLEAIPVSRTKPWGTGHAVLCARSFIHSPFAVLNADDYYGPRALVLLAQFLKTQATNTLSGALIGYRLRSTLSPHGPVSRAICEQDGKGHLKNLKEYTKIVATSQGLIDQAEPGKTLDPEATVSLNAWAFTHPFLDTLEIGLRAFLEKLGSVNTTSAEYYLPSAVSIAIREEGAPFSILPTDDAYAGLTYVEDLPTLKALIKSHHTAGHYPETITRAF